MGNPAPDPVVLRGHGADVQCLAFARLDDARCLLSGRVLRPRASVVAARSIGSIRDLYTGPHTTAFAW